MKKLLFLLIAMGAFCNIFSQTNERGFEIDPRCQCLTFVYEN
jgi:hypothetical protein